MRSNHARSLGLTAMVVIGYGMTWAILPTLALAETALIYVVGIVLLCAPKLSIMALDFVTRQPVLTMFVLLALLFGMVGLFNALKL